jgi:predicted metal-dependent peptidase
MGMMNERNEMINREAAMNTAKIVGIVTATSLSLNALVYYSPELFITLLVMGLVAFMVKVVYDIQLSHIECQKHIRELDEIRARYK